MIQLDFFASGGALPEQDFLVFKSMQYRKNCLGTFWKKTVMGHFCRYLTWDFLRVFLIPRWTIWFILWVPKSFANDLTCCPSLITILTWTNVNFNHKHCLETLSNHARGTLPMPKCEWSCKNIVCTIHGYCKILIMLLLRQERHSNSLPPIIQTCAQDVTPEGIFKY